MIDPADRYRAKLEAVLNELLAELPDDPNQRLEAARDIRRTFLVALGRAIEPAFNRFVASHPLETPDDYRNLAASVNEQLRQLSLGLHYPGRPESAAILVADCDRGDPEAMRFRLSIRDQDGEHRKLLSRDIPRHLRLVPRPERVEGRARHR